MLLVPSEKNRPAAYRQGHVDYSKDNIYYDKSKRNLFYFFAVSHKLLIQSFRIIKKN